MRPGKKIWVAALFLPCALFAGCADKKAAETLYIKALERYEQKDFKASSAFINQSLKIDKKNERAKFLNAKINFFQGRYGDAKEILLDLKKSNNDNKDIERYLIRSLILLEDYDQAREQIEAALKNDRGDWRLWQLDALVAAKEQDTERRLRALNSALESLKGSALVYFDLALVWDALGAASKAQEFKEKALALDKDLEELF